MQKQNELPNPESLTRQQIAALLDNRQDPQGFLLRKTGSSKKSKKRQTLLVRFMANSRLRDVLAILHEKNASPDKALFQAAARNGLLELMAQTPESQSRLMIKAIADGGEKITREDLFPHNTPVRLTHSFLCQAPDDVVDAALATSGDRLRKQDLLRHNRDGKSLLLQLLLNKRHSLAFGILNRPGQGMTAEDLNARRGAESFFDRDRTIMEQIIHSRKPENLLKLPMAPGEEISPQMWRKVINKVTNVRPHWDMDLFFRLKELAGAREWCDRPFSEFMAFRTEIEKSEIAQEIDLTAMASIIHACHIKNARRAHPRGARP